VQFDWTRILKQPATMELQRPQPQQRHGAKPSRSVNVPAPQPQMERDEEPAEHLVETSPVETLRSTAAIDIDPTAIDDAEVESVSGDDPLAVEREAERQQEPASETEEEEEPRLPAVFTRIGAEGLARLRARYAEVMARISDRPMEEDAREELKGRAERLNPDAWVTDDEVRQGLEQYETVFESLRSVVGHPRRRRRRRS
jgi:hypothetical protein